VLEFLKSWVLNIVILAVLIVLLEMLVPSGKIKKFINLVTGFVLVIAIITPFLNFFKSGIDLKEFQIANRNFINRKEIENNSKIMNERQMKQITETYRNKIIDQLEEIAEGISEVSEAEADVIINEDYNSKTFGEIKRAYIYIELKKSGEQVKPATKIEKIQISPDETTKKDKNSESEEISDTAFNEVKAKIEKRINKVLGIEPESIVISFNGD
jgi:stage III sporulation protein AF